MFDPPEYVNWESHSETSDEFDTTLSRDRQRSQIIAELTETQFLEMYTGLLRFRLHDITLRRWVKQGILAKAWLGTGEEAVTVGNVHALNRKVDKVGPMIRNAGACHEMGISVADMLREYLGTADSPSKGKDLHIGNVADGVIAPASQVAALTPVFAGMALAIKQRAERKRGSAQPKENEEGVVLTWIGDGATKTTAFHEGVNLAAVLHVPVIYVIQNNQVALGTRLEQHQAGPLTAWAKAYGVTGLSCAGNNVLDVYAVTRIAADIARSGRGPVMLFAETFRMGGHATHDEREARELFPPAVFEYWGRRDPIGMYEAYLQRRGIRKSVLEDVEQRVIEDIGNAEKEALLSLEQNMPKPETVTRGVYADQDAEREEISSKPGQPRASSTRKMPSR